jgi:[CysO sulfur-carrier protein]-S-L-cysteine hydrolase
MTDSQSRSTVRVYPVRSDADIAVARLAADGIHASVHQDDEGGLNPGFFKRYGVRVEVSTDDLEDAYQSLGVERVHVPGPVAEAMFRHAGWALPNEACGLIAVDNEGRPAFAMCLTNIDLSPRRFTIDPVEHFGAIRFCESIGLRVGAVFHSHVKTEAVPSATDVEAGLEEDWLHFIVGPVVGQRPLLRAFRITDGVVEEASVVVQA